MASINQRDLRNNSGEVMRAVRAGETFVVTVRGVPVATLAPISAGAVPDVARPATTRLDPAQFTRVSLAEPTAALLDDLRGDR
jgi:prevent-host-death family protein